MIGFDSEEGFQAHLDANPEDHFAREVFADWLEDRDDPRAEGYRALGVLGRFPFVESKASYLWHNEKRYGTNDPDDLKTVWFLAITHFTRKTYMTDWWVRFPSRRKAEDAAAIAFSQLRSEDRACIFVNASVWRPPQGV